MYQEYLIFVNINKHSHSSVLQLLSAHSFLRWGLPFLVDHVYSDEQAHMIPTTPLSEYLYINPPWHPSGCFLSSHSEAGVLMSLLENDWEWLFKVQSEVNLGGPHEKSTLSPLWIFHKWGRGEVCVCVCVCAYNKYILLGRHRCRFRMTPSLRRFSSYDAFPLGRRRKEMENW